MRNFHPILIWLLVWPLGLRAQTPIQVTPQVGIQLQVQQPAPDVDSPVTATAEFDPPQIHPGQKAYYRVQMNATETTVDWPAAITAAPDGLVFGPVANGQIMPFVDGTFRATSGFTYEVAATHPGHFTVPAFSVDINGRPVAIPAAELTVLADNAPATTAGRRLLLQTAQTNVYLGEPFRVRVILPASPANQIQTVNDLQINGEGFIPDKTTLSQSFTRMTIDGESRIAFIYQITLTPIATGELKFSAQGFCDSPRNFNGGITISGPAVIEGGRPRAVLLVSDATQVQVQPLPADGELPGFTGSIGAFAADAPHLSADHMQVGEPVHLQLSIHPLGDLTRLVPPLVPDSRDWQIIPDEPAGMGFTLIPLTDDVQKTPEIPYSSFDPATGHYVDLTAPALPVTVRGESLPVQLTAMDEPAAAAPLKLSSLATTPGKSVLSLKPLQLRGWLGPLLLLPVFGFYVLVRWDRHRRFLAAHPEIVRRRQARRALRREKRHWRTAIANGDTAGFLNSAANAMKVACAPHFPAHPGALVCADVLAQLEAEDQTGPIGDTVRKIFSITETRFAAVPTATVDVLALEAKVDAVLMKLEEKL